MKYDNTTLYLRGWHLHAPADHSVGGDRSKSELHMVHVTAEGDEGAVLAIRLDPGVSPSPFFSQLPPMIGFNDTSQEMGVEIDPRLALDGVNDFSEFWTYQGSLTSPPCKEGIRWFVARLIMFTSNEQMRAILAASSYSARAEQEVWLHQINV
jgi:carbonic anhydrase